MLTNNEQIVLNNIIKNKVTSKMKIAKETKLSTNLVPELLLNLESKKMIEIKNKETSFWLIIPRTEVHQ